MNQIEIDHNVPVTPKATRRGGGWAHILRQMRTGDSIVLTTQQRNAAFVAGRAMRIKLISRTAGNGSYRVWRVRAPRNGGQK
jgi:hypothetical protein